MVYLPKPHKIEDAKQVTKDVKYLKIKSGINPLPGKFFQVSIPGVGECPLASSSYDDKFLNILVRNAGNVTSRIFELDKGDDIFIRFDEKISSNFIDWLQISNLMFSH